MNLLTYIIVQTTNWLFRKRSPALFVFRTGASFFPITLMGGVAFNAQYSTTSQLIRLDVVGSDVPTLLVFVGFSFSILLMIVGLFWEIIRSVMEHRKLTKKVVFTIEQRGLVNTSDSPLSEHIRQKHKGKQISNTVIDIRDSLANGTVSKPKLALKKFLNLELSIEERRNSVTAEDFHVVYGGLVPIPFAFLSGYLLDDESSVEVLDWDRQISCWRALDAINDDLETFEVIKKQATRKDAVVLAVSFSYLVDEKAIDQCFPNMPQVHLRLATKRFDNHWSSQKQSRLAYDLIENVKSIMADGYEEIHLVLASQNSVAFKFGQAYDRRNLPPITIYQYEKNNDVPYPWGVHITNVAHAAPSIITTPSNDHLKRAV
ncbi:2-methylthioadenine synthetase [Vibrio crassostreae]|nr:2-methylthioadenine synthetase [Vibrio crassostreae]CAK2947261.1 2-methylthioadenine synthetase [Vibrio crassostreae]CAK2948964.1 2-methylthioadenine synthetase [Vibrio crassostreae]CAK2950445.1 2-methylthioadenine synthetase [Vibrio crassostreae]CAK2950690.1 2-methylthioadenine synthetase [Vibrio crassostreae]